MKPKTIAALVLAVLLFIILLQNMEPVRFKALFWTFAEVPLLLLVIGSLLLGWIAGWFTHMGYIRGKKKENSELPRAAE